MSCTDLLREWTHKACGQKPGLLSHCKSSYNTQKLQEKWSTLQARGTKLRHAVDSHKHLSEDGDNTSDNTSKQASFSVAQCRTHTAVMQCEKEHGGSCGRQCEILYNLKWGTKREHCLLFSGKVQKSIWQMALNVIITSWIKTWLWRQFENFLFYVL